MDITNISLGLDIATALSVVGASIAYIRNLNRERRQSVSEEREHERIIKFSEMESEYNKVLTKFMQFGTNGKLNEAINEMGKIYHYCHINMRKHFSVYATQDELKILKNTIDRLLQSYKELQQKGQFDAVKLTNDLVELDILLLVRLRQLMNNESESESRQIIEQFAVEYFKYKKANKS